MEEELPTITTSAKLADAAMTLVSKPNLSAADRTTFVENLQKAQNALEEFVQPKNFWEKILGWLINSSRDMEIAEAVESLQIAKKRLLEVKTGNFLNAADRDFYLNVPADNINYALEILDGIGVEIA